MEDMNVVDDDLDLESFAEAAPKATPKVETPPPPVDGVGCDDLEDFVGDIKTADQIKTEALRKPWMQFHEFRLVKTIDEVRALVDSAIEHGRCALDLETEGLDNRIDYDKEGKPHTRHKIVGYCISVKGVGHYLPIGHKFLAEMGEPNPNLPLQETNAEIKRLCLASQPVVVKDAPDQYASPQFEIPPRVVIYFWHAKFDQEFLYPITGIYFWHPDSFQDGMLSTYVLYTEDILGLKENAEEHLSIQDPETGAIYPYEMIKFAQLFEPVVPKELRKFSVLRPTDGSSVVLYACSDAICTELLCETKKVAWKHTVKGLKYSYKSPVGPSYKPKFRGILRLEKQSAQGAREMERSRTLVDKGEIDALLEEAYTERQEFEDKLVAAAKAKGFEKFNPSSTAQLSDFLFTKRGLDLPNKPEKNESSGQYKTDAKTLEAIYENNQEVEVLRWIVMYRQIDKIIGTYLTKLASNTDEHGQLRFNFQQTGAATGRFTAPQGDPDQGFAGVPIHGIPAKTDPKRPKVANSLRRLFVAHEGYVLVKIDYAGQELRVVTCVSKEPKWRHEFLEGTGDLHTLTAQAFFGPHITKNHKKERTAGKIANFSLIYGGGVGAIQRATGCDKVEAARKKEAFDASVPVFSGWVKQQHTSVKKNRGITTGFGRFVSIPDADIKVGEYTTRTKKHPSRMVVDEKDARKIRASCERQSTNYPIQGSGADILKISLVKLTKLLHSKGWLKDNGDDSVRMLMTVHDEIVFEVRKDRLMEVLPELVRVMESPPRIVGWDIPFYVEPLVGKSWDAKFDWEDVMKGKTTYFLNKDKPEEPLPQWFLDIVEPKGENWRLPFEDEPRSNKAPADAPLVKDDENAPEPEPMQASESKPTTTSKASTPPPAPTSKPKPVPSQDGQVAVFAIPSTYLTRQSVRIVAQVIKGAEPFGGESGQSKFKTLQVIDESGGILIDPKLGIKIDPEEFGRGLADRNLGAGTYDLVNLT